MRGEDVADGGHRGRQRSETFKCFMGTGHEESGRLTSSVVGSKGKGW